VKSNCDGSRTQRLYLQELNFYVKKAIKKKPKNNKNETIKYSTDITLSFAMNLVFLLKTDISI
jgi:hypothetical protein